MRKRARLSISAPSGAATARIADSSSAPRHVARLSVTSASMQMPPIVVVVIVVIAVVIVVIEEVRVGVGVVVAVVAVVVAVAWCDHLRECNVWMANLLRLPHVF